MVGLESVVQSRAEFKQSKASTDPIRVILVEDDAMTAKRLMNQCSVDGRARIVLWAASAHEAYDAIQQVQFDLALVDLGLPDESGIEVIRFVARHLPSSESLVLSTFGDSQSVLEAVKAGASGYLLKGQSEAAEIIDGLVDVARGAASISPAIARHLLSSFPNGAGLDCQIDDADISSLTRRERELLKFVGHGYMVKEIAEKLFLSPHTVSTHFKNVYRKLHVGTRGEAVYIARKAGII